VSPQQQQQQHNGGRLHAVDIGVVSGVGRAPLGISRELAIIASPAATAAAFDRRPPVVINAAASG